MPDLENLRHEWFARARANGYRLEDAYECAGYVPDRGHACRLAARPEVASRINELRNALKHDVPANKISVIQELVEIGRLSRRMDTPVGYKESRLAILEAGRLHEELVQERAQDRQVLAMAMAREARERSQGGLRDSRLEVSISKIGAPLTREASTER
jgi:hypothetical protein